MWIDPLIWCICMYTPLPRSSSSSSADLQVCNNCLEMSPSMLKLPMFLLLLLPMTLGQTTLRGTHIKVTTVISRPFIMQVPNLIRGERWPEKSINNWPRCCFFLRYYEGFLVDMLSTRLSTRLGFTFTIHENPEGRYGTYVGGKWNGMIAEVLNSSTFCIFFSSHTSFFFIPNFSHGSSSPTFFYLSSCSC